MLTRFLIRLREMFTHQDSPSKLTGRSSGETWPANDGSRVPYDPTHGRIDKDIQEYVAEHYPDVPLGSRCAIENTMQNKRDRGY